MVSTATPTPPPSSGGSGTVAPWQFIPSRISFSGLLRYNVGQGNPYFNTDIPGYTATGWGSTGSPDMLPAESLWSGFTPAAKQNPPFLSMAAGQLIESLDFGGAGGRPARLLRGFIRRTYNDTNDPNSDCRLNFMFNPPAIQRDYVSYLDQGALDPFNTIYNSGNLVAPPSVLNFTFELFFDRQNEAMDANDPGVFVDQEFFDRVVRGVRDTQVGPNAVGVPDNGLILSGAQDITVVFSPQLSVSGRPINASVSYVKFTHRMIPTRMVISITIRAVRIGPAVRDVPDYKPEEFTAVDRVAVEDQETPVASFTRVDLDWASTDVALNTLIIGQQDFSDRFSTTGNGSAVDHAKTQVAKFGTKYDGNNRMNLWTSADCSSLVWAGFAEIGKSEALGWPKWPESGQVEAPSTYLMWKGLKDSTAATKIWGFPGTPARSEGLKSMQKGDLVLRIRGDGSVQGENHIAFVDSNDGSTITLFHAKSTSLGVGSSSHAYATFPNTYNYCLRPLTSGGSMAANAHNEQNRFTG